MRWRTAARGCGAAQPATLPELFAAQAARTPEAAAVMFEDRVLSYAALDAHANRLAHHLQSLGVGPETVVGLLVERSPEMVVGLLGILKAGGAYLPLDPDYPRERLAFMLADAGAAVLVTQPALLDRLPAAAAAGAAGAARRRLAGDRAPARHRAAARPRSRATPPMSSTPPAPPARQRASSSSMRSLANKMLALGENFDVREDFRSALFISSSFDASIEQTLLPFIGGGAAVVISDDVRESPSQFWQQFDRNRVTFMSCVPAYLESILNQAPDTVSLKHLALGGEALTLQFKNKVSRHLKVGADHQSLRSDRSHHRRHFPCRRRRRCRSQYPDRPSDGQLPGVCAGRWT